jgi:hypothetical protein
MVDLTLRCMRGAQGNAAPLNDSNTLQVVTVHIGAATEKLGRQPVWS